MSHTRRCRLVDQLNYVMLIDDDLEQEYDRKLHHDVPTRTQGSWSSLKSNSQASASPSQLKLELWIASSD